jgi:hypothetical protein
MKCVALAGLIATGLTLSPASVKASPIAPAGIAPALDRDLVQGPGGLEPPTRPL